MTASAVDIKAQRRERTEANRAFRRARFQKLIDHPDIIVLRTLSGNGSRIMHYEWPRSKYIDFWPASCTYKWSDGRTGEMEWRRLLRRLNIAREELESP